MSTTAIAITDFLLEQARLVRGVHEYEDFATYMHTPESARNQLNAEVVTNYSKVMKTITKMASYGPNHWWVTTSNNFSDDVLEETEDVLDLKKKIRVYYQIFDCGLETLLVRQGQLVNDINDLLIYTREAVTSWILLSPALFAKHKERLKQLLENDKKLHAYVQQYATNHQ